METATVTLKIPKAAAVYFADDDESLSNERKALLMYPYIKNGVLSHGRVAELLGMNKFELISIYERLGLPYLQMSWAEVEDDIQNTLTLINNG